VATRPWAFHVAIDATLRDTDGLGHVNNAVYLSWIETARTRYVFERRRLERIEQLDFVLAAAHLEFRSPVYLHETVDLRCSPSRVGRSSWEMAFEGRVQDRLCLTARTVQVQYDYATKASRPIPDDWRTLLEADLRPGEPE
jgi:acyl-CoA thioester hydrolase